MRAFFRGWKRKFGVVTLLMAAIVSFVWGRSHFLDSHYDVLKSKSASQRLIASNGCLIWESFQADVPAHYFPTAILTQGTKALVFVCTDEDFKNYCEVHFELTPKDLKPSVSRTRSGKSLFSNAWWGQWRGFGYGSWRGWATLFVVSVPFWSFVLSLGLLSVVLFFFKPVKSTQMSADDSIGRVDQSAFAAFFQGWRRKAGFVVLVASCLFMMAWLRSLSVADVVSFSTQEHRHEIDSANGQLKWVVEANSYSSRYFSHHSQPLNHYLKQREALSEEQRDYWAIAEKSGKRKTWAIACWLVTLPLTLVSILLLLVRPRKSVAKKAEEPINEPAG